MILTQAQLAAVFRVDQRTIRRWTTTEGLSRARTGEDGRYDLSEAVAWWGERLAEDDELRAEQVRLTRARADAAEFELAARRGEYMATSAATAALREALTMGNRALTSAPRKLAKRWAKRLRVREAQTIELIEQIVEDIRAILRTAADAQETSEDHPA